MLGKNLKEFRCPDCEEIKIKYRGGRCQKCFYARKLRRSIEKRGTGKCKHCGTIFQKQKTKHDYCSDRCLGEKRWNFQREKHTAKCSLCDESFIKITPWQKFCTDKCKEDARQKRRFAWKTKRQAAAKLDCVCLFCGNSFTALRRQYANKSNKRTPKFCSPRCMYLGRRGKASPLYRGPANGTRGITWHVIAANVRLRDGKVCKMCSGVNTKALSVDHVIPERLMRKWSLFAHAEENLISLCMSCHSKKTNSEEKLLKGDFMGFYADMRRIGYPEYALKSAFEYAGMKCDY